MVLDHRETFRFDTWYEAALDFGTEIGVTGQGRESVESQRRIVRDQRLGRLIVVGLIVALVVSIMFAAARWDTIVAIGVPA